jgi:hypothetical protein
VYGVRADSQKYNFVWLGLTAVLLAGVVVWDRGDDVVGHVIVLGAFLGYLCLYMLFATCRITLTDAGVVLGARVRQRFIAWPDLVWVDFGTGTHGVLRWQTRSRRRPILTRLTIVGIHSMLAEVGQRAPHVRVTISSAAERRRQRQHQRRSGVDQ